MEEWEKNVILTALKRQDEVILFVRAITVIPDEIRTNNKVEIIHGDYSNEGDIRNAIISCKPEAIITATRLIKRGNKPFHESAVRTIVSTLFSINQLNKIPLIYLGGVLIGPNKNPFSFSLFIKQCVLPLLAPFVGEAEAIADHQGAYNYLLLESMEDLNFVIVRPGKMKEMPSSGNMIASNRLPSQSSPIPYVDVASFLVECCHNDTLRTSRSCTYVDYS